MSKLESILMDPKLREELNYERELTYRILRSQESMAESINELVKAVKYVIRVLQHTKSFRIFQVTKENCMAITGVTVGGQGTFTEIPQPVGDLLPAGVIPVWSTTDTNVTLTPSTDGTSVVAAVASTDTATSFPLTVTATLPDGTTPTGTATIPILPSEVTSFTINQTA